MLTRSRGECNQDVWCLFNFRIHQIRFSIIVTAISPLEPSPRCSTSVTVASIGVWHALKCGPVNPSLVNVATYILLIADLRHGRICMPSCLGGSTYPDLFYFTVLSIPETHPVTSDCGYFYRCVRQSVFPHSLCATANAQKSYEFSSNLFRLRSEFLSPML